MSQLHAKNISIHLEEMQLRWKYREAIVPTFESLRAARVSRDINESFNSFQEYLNIRNRLCFQYFFMATKNNVSAASCRLHVLHNQSQKSTDNKRSETCSSHYVIRANKTLAPYYCQWRHRGSARDPHPFCTSGDTPVRSSNSRLHASTRSEDKVVIPKIATIEATLQHFSCQFSICFLLVSIFPSFFLLLLFILPCPVFATVPACIRALQQ